ncbi:MAG: sulfite exporter TauE/SafE family protein [Pseudomonadota bacterium]
MTFDLWFFIAAIPATLFAGVSKAGFGSGAAFASSAILALVVEPSAAIGLMLPLLMVIDAASLKPYWGKWDWGLSWPVIWAAIPGVALGALIYQFANDNILRALIGGIALAFVAYDWSKRAGLLKLGARKFPTWVGALTGAVAGFTSFVSHAGGPPVAVYLLSQGVGKGVYQASSVLIFWAINLFKFVPYTFLGIFTAQTLVADLILVPFALLGTWLGVRAHRVVSETWFFRITYILLLITGTRLLVTAF